VVCVLVAIGGSAGWWAGEGHKAWRKRGPVEEGEGERKEGFRTKFEGVMCFMIRVSIFFGQICSEMCFEIDYKSHTYEDERKE
jgi:hypothetical protein